MFGSIRRITKEEPRSLVAAVLLTAVVLAGVHFLGNYLTTTMDIILGVLLVIMLSIVMVMAGFTVLKCLFIVAAELSLLIFLGQSYCAVPTRTPAGNSALGGLIIVGLLYIAVEFFRSLYNALKEQYKKIGNEQVKENKFGIAVYLLFTVVFVTQIYQVVTPIIQNLCIYREPSITVSPSSHAGSRS